MPERTRAESRRAALDDLAKIVELNEPILRASLPEESHGRLPKAQEPLASAIRSLLTVLAHYKQTINRHAHMSIRERNHHYDVVAIGGSAGALPSIC